MWLFILGNIRFSKICATSHKFKKDMFKDIAAWFGFSLSHSQARNEGWVVDDFKKFCLDSLVLLAIAHVDPSMADYHPDWHEYVASEIRSPLGHEKSDKTSAKQFREEWMAIVGIIRSNFLAKQAASSPNPHLLEARNAFIDTRAEWDSEKGSLYVKEML
ncbi:hypothetical protein R1sor_022178 [Riccia sorocarpa]|uniref:Uncharacterized protein n=1 Tax=Riccia sorocarpa TaxID=122646 RepID=A0ABD3GM36_9MARC